MDKIYEILSSLNIEQDIGINNIIDILIVSVVIYKVLMLVKETRAEQLIKGIIILLIALKFSEWANLVVIHFLLKNTVTIGAVALLIVFQPELRKALEYLGRSKFLKQSFMEFMDEEVEDHIHELMDAITALSRTKTGALIVMEQEAPLLDIAQTGTRLDSRITTELVQNVFFPNSPLHDGAMIIRKGRIEAAGCILPLSDSHYISKELGTRHRAALGLVENTDALVLIVSEETGTISMAREGKLHRHLDGRALEKLLRGDLIKEQKNSFLMDFWRRKNDKSAK